MKLIKARKDESDKSTLVSIFHRDIKFQNYSIFPGVFKLPKGTIERPSTLTIGQSIWVYNNFQSDESVEMVEGSLNMAQSLIRDCITAMISYAPNQHPGLFFVKDSYDNQSILKHPEYGTRAKAALVAQENWYKKLVEEADTSFVRTGGNPKSIYQDAKYAARYLNLMDKPWIKDQAQMDLKACPFCGFLRKGEFPKCSNCHEVIDTVAYNKMRDVLTGANQIKAVK